MRSSLALSTTCQRIVQLYLMVVAMTGLNATELNWKELPPLPDRHGFASMFAGVSHGRLLAAGGANFPELPPWQGGTKVWYDTVYCLDHPGGSWTIAGKLPRPLAYGVSAVWNNSVLCAGGSDATRHYSDVFRLEYVDGHLQTMPLPPLPIPIANACGAIVGDRFLVAGGVQTPTATATLTTVYALDLPSLDDSGKTVAWTKLASLPGTGRMLATAASVNGEFWVLGGTDLVPGNDGLPQRRYLPNAWRLFSDGRWEQLPDLPHPVVAAPSPAPVHDHSPLILGGDDGSQVSVGPEQHRGFSRSVLTWDQNTRTWISVGSLPAPRVTVPMVSWNKRSVMVSGEMRPGIRSPQVWALEVR